MVDLSRSKRVPYAHQIVGVERMVQTVEPEIGRIYPGCFFLADEMRLGKTKQVIDTAQALFEMREIRFVIVVAPAQVRDVWFDPDLGEIQKHRWDGIPTLVTDYHSNIRKWTADTDNANRYLTWIVTNYEYLRYGVKRGKKGWSGPYLEPLVTKVASDQTLLVLDESSMIANADSLQHRACAVLRSKCGRIIELNGTPILETPEDLFAQAKMLDYRIFGIKYVSQFRARYAIEGGYEAPVYEFFRGHKVLKTKIDPKTGKKVPVTKPTEVVGWRHKPKEGCCDIPLHVESPVHADGPGLEEIQERLAPYILRRIRSECLDLPPKLEPVTMTAVLTPATWKIYCAMRDELVAWLSQDTVATAAQAGNKVMRLAQITSGFVGGLRDEAAECPECGIVTPVQVAKPGDPLPLPYPEPPLATGGLNLELGCPSCGGTGLISAPRAPEIFSREKLDVYLAWVKNRLKEDPNFRLITWCRFQIEAHRIIAEMKEKFPGVKTLGIYGGQKKADRQEGLRLMHPEVIYEGPADLVGTLQTGSVGLNMAGGHDVIYFSNTPSWYHRSQSEDRPHGPGQTQPIWYGDIVAVGPKGQHTIEHHILKGLRGKKDLAKYTCSAWIEALRLE